MGVVSWGGYDTPITILATTQLNGLAVGAISAVGAVINNTTGVVYADVEYVSTGTFSPTGGSLLIWLLRSLDGGVSYEDGGPTVEPPRLRDLAIAIRAGSSISVRAGAPRLTLPPAFYRPILQNNSGASLPTGSFVRWASYTQVL